MGTGKGTIVPSRRGGVIVRSGRRGSEQITGKSKEGRVGGKEGILKKQGEKGVQFGGRREGKKKKAGGNTRHAAPENQGRAR